ncbi:hypothetical protein AB4304_14510 [Vibrio breoganii]|uniref:hypothetical protein n=1 Tax=Vibrio breoganii TaxID=553239 RepID=UPI000C8593A8|nr:hypothetical protein [Vibrio breoganii]PMK79550.1 hypothetical protein BCT94_18780 [Vibrio breoganii]
MRHLYRLLKVFIDGLYSSVKVINNGNFSSHREINDKKFMKMNKKIKWIYLIYYLNRDFYSKSIPRYKINYSRIKYAGHTGNNLKQFEFFYSLCSSEINVSDRPSSLNNIATAKKNGTIKLVSLKVKTFKVMLMVTTYIVLLLGRIKLNSTSYKYVSDYIFCFFVYLINFERNSSILPSVVVFSNDHNPKYVAISKVCKYFCIKRLYMQHASVSNIFPKLDFEVSVLLDQYSENIYRKIGVTSSKLLKISRNENIEYRASTTYKEITNVLIVPSSVFSEIALTKMVEYLSFNKDIKNVFVKLHPRTKLEDRQKYKAIFVDDIKGLAPQNTVVIGGNTSMVLEMLLLKYQSFQFFDLDNITKDYYGYVNQGLVDELLIDDLSTKFWNEDFVFVMNKLSDYDPYISGTHYKDIARLNNWLIKNINTDRIVKSQAEFMLSNIKRNNLFVFEILDITKGDDSSFAVIDIFLRKNVISIEEKNIIERYYLTR